MLNLLKIIQAKSEVRAFINLRSLEFKSDDYSFNGEPTLKPLTRKSSSLTSLCLLLSRPLYRYHGPICDEWTAAEHFTDWLNRFRNGSANKLR